MYFAGDGYAEEYVVVKSGMCKTRSDTATLTDRGQ